MEKNIICFPSSMPGGLNATFLDEFGRCDVFTCIVQENGKIVGVNVEQNDAKNAMGRAGIKAVDIVKSMNPNHAVVGHLGPNAYTKLSKTDIKIHLLKHKSGINIKQAYEEFTKGNVSKMTSPNVEPKHAY
jgi:predicted Fe-Mo cluster-binding NifX family protein